MARPKRARALHQQQSTHPDSNTNHGTGKKHRKMSSFAKLSTKNNYNNSANKENNKENNALARKNEKHQQKQHRRLIVPFHKKDRILLVGEGDFSFAHSLATYHCCKNILATCYDSQETLYAKYPQAEKNISEIVGSLKTKTQPKSGRNDDNAAGSKNLTGPKVLFSVDAKKLGSATGGGKDVRIGFPRLERKRPVWKKDGNKRSTRFAEATGDNVSNKGKDIGKEKGGPWDMICFNFPHVGGLSRDVNRQVRANQELLVAFFKACMPLLAERPEELGSDDEVDDDCGFETDGEDGSDEGEAGNDDDENGTVKAKDERRSEPGQILVTLFEGEPYTLWNIRDLARHAGLSVVTSFKFPWACYRGYSHARTLGEIEGKDGGRGGWRGEDREARTYVFEVKTDDRSPSGTTKKRKQRPTDTNDSDSD